MERMPHSSVAARIDAIEAKLGRRFFPRGPHKVKPAAARARLPKTALVRGRKLAEARALLADPATARSLDPTRIEETCALPERHPGTVPEGKYRRRAISAMIGTVAMRSLVTLALLPAVLHWRDLV
jgi:hypothetical protein